jgi:hypothetical protein
LPSNRILQIPADVLDATAEKLQYTLENEMEIFV